VRAIVHEVNKNKKGRNLFLFFFGLGGVRLDFGFLRWLWICHVFYVEPMFIAFFLVDAESEASEFAKCGSCWRSQFEMEFISYFVACGARAYRGYNSIFFPFWENLEF